MIGYVVLGVFGRTVGLGVGIDTEHTIVTGLAGPHPVVCLTPELTHRLRNGEYQADILKVTIGRQIVFVAFVERFHLHTEGRVLLTDTLAPCVLDRVDKVTHLLDRQTAQSETVEGVRHIFLLHHETHKEVLVRKLFCV